MSKAIGGYMEYLLSKEEMQAVINGDHGNVFAVLGIHRDKGSKEVFIRAYQPNTRSIEVLKNDGTSLGMMTKLDDRGFYQINLGVGENFAYRFKIENDLGNTYMAEDAYRFQSNIGDIDAYLFAEGTHLDMYKKLGAHPMTMDGVAGVSFAVWAPNAKRVSVVGGFNNWDGRVNVMRKHPTCGVWDIFIPGIGQGELYKYEIKTQQDYILVKSDPVAFYSEKRPNTASVVYNIENYHWEDENWMNYREQANSFDRLRGSSRFLASQGRTWRGVFDLPRVCRLSCPLCQQYGLYACRVSAAVRTSAGRFLGVSGYRHVRADFPFRQSGRFPLYD